MPLLNNCMAGSITQPLRYNFIGTSYAIRNLNPNNIYF